MIRRAESADYHAMDAIFRASAKALCIANYDNEIITTWAGAPWPERFVQNADGGDDQYVSIVNGELACFGAINIIKQLLVSLFVAPAYAGQGIGREMINHLALKAKAAGIEVLRVDSSLNAVNFYLKNGFIEIGRSNFKTQNGVIMKSVQMECELSTKNEFYSDSL